jgi:hypothetical protein
MRLKKIGEDAKTSLTILIRLSVSLTVWFDLVWPRMRSKWVLKHFWGKSMFFINGWIQMTPRSHSAKLFRQSNCTVLKSMAFYSVARFRRSAAVDKLWQLWYDSIRYDMMVFKFQIVIFLLVCHPKKRPQLYPPIAFIIGFFAVFCGLQWSFFDVPNQQDNC